MLRHFNISRHTHYQLRLYVCTEYVCMCVCMYVCMYIYVCIVQYIQYVGNGRWGLARQHRIDTHIDTKRQEKKKSKIAMFWTRGCGCDVVCVDCRGGGVGGWEPEEIVVGRWGMCIYIRVTYFPLSSNFSFFTTSTIFRSFPPA